MESGNYPWCGHLSDFSDFWVWDSIVIQDDTRIDMKNFLFERVDIEDRMMSPILARQIFVTVILMHNKMSVNIHLQNTYLKIYTSII